MTQNTSPFSALKIGIAKHDTQLAFTAFIEQKLKLGIHARVEVFETQEDAFKAVSEGKIDVFACHLNAAPLDLPLGLVITAVSERLDTNNCFVTLNENGLVFGENKTPKILVLSDINRAQMQYLHPHFEVIKTEMSPNETIKAVRSGAFDAVVLSQTELSVTALKMDKWQIQMLNMREFVPIAGQSVACFITAVDDLPTRRLLKEAHHPSVSAVTNIERTIQKMLNQHEVSAYCERDRMGNYHLWAAALVNNDFKKIRLSQSTTFGMAENAVQQLLSA